MDACASAANRLKIGGQELSSLHIGPLSNESAIALYRGNLEICCTVIAAETDIEAHRHDLTQINTRPLSEVNNIS